MNGIGGHRLHLPEGDLRRLEAGLQLECVPQVDGRLLVVPVRLEDLAEREVLLPGTLVRRLHLERPARQVDGVVEILQREKHTGQVQQYLGVVR